MSQFDHPNIVKLLGYCENPRVIVMKFYSMSLKSLISDPGFANDNFTNMKISIDIASGMKAIHAKEVIHFDLKPQNVLIDVQADLSIFCVICDFGFANFRTDGKHQLVSGMKAPTTAGITARYAAPEVSNLTIRMLLKDSL